VRRLQRFLAASPVAPRLWGLHNYGDTTYGRTSGTDAVLVTVPGELWLEETARLAATRTVVLRVRASAPLAASSTASLRVARPG
jgi:hypothetical protein